MDNGNAILNPFPGLRAFEEEEDILFFGREKQIDELLRKLRTSRFLAIIGSSGSGKSSLVKSGLLPSLHSGLMSGVGSQWRIALFRPGNDPIGQLNLALSKNGVLRDNQSQEELEINTSINETILRRSNLGLIEAYKQSGLDKKNNLLVLVDQFEEIFRFSRYEKEAGEGKRDSIAFINLLLKAAEQKELPIYVVFTMRSDFLGDCTEFRGLPEAINEGQYLVPRMTREERREAITGPIAVGNGTITPALVNRLLNDVGDNPDQLPILQHAMMRTWNEWKDKKHPEIPIDIEDYEQIGTISEALSQHAEEAYSELSSDRERTICEVLFKELTDKGGLSSGIRRPRLLSELCAAADAKKEEVIKVIEVFRKPGRGFLMPSYPAALTENSIIDISHESIMRVWKRLMTWLEEEEESAQIYLHLCEAVNLYESGKGGLWRDPELQIAIKWKEEQNKNAAWASRYNNYFDKVIFFLDHSRQKRDLEIQRKEELQKQRLRTSRRISVAVGVVALLAFVGGLWAFSLKIKADKSEKAAIVQKNNADDQRKKAEESKKLAQLARSAAEVAKDSANSSEARAMTEKKNAEDQKRIALQESQRAREEKTKADISAQDALHSKQVADENAEKAERSKREAEKSQLTALREKAQAEKLKKVAESKNEAHKAVTYMNDSDYNNCLKLSLQAYQDNQANEGDFQDDDIYNALYMTWQNSIKYKNMLTLHAVPVRALVDMPHGDFICSGDESGKIIISQNNQGVISKKSEVDAGDGVRALAVDPDGNYLLAVLLGQAELFRINTDNSLQKPVKIKFAGGGRHGVFLDNKYFLVQSTERITRYAINDPSVKVDSVKIPGCSSLIAGSNGKIFVAAGKSIFEYAGWNEMSKPPMHKFSLASTVTSMALDKSGKYLAAGTYAGGIWLQDLNNRQSEPFYRVLHKSAVNDIKFSVVMDGRLQLASASSDKFIKLMEVTGDDNLNYEHLISVADHNNWVYGLAYSENGKYLFSGGEDQNVIACPTTMKYIYNALTNK